MSKLLHLQVLAPTGLLLDAPAESVILPGADGALGVMAGHAPMLAALGPGKIRYRVGPDWKELAIPGGTAEATAERLLVLLTAE